jgi:protein-L-isoaspartate(D-aspartate) O-methyltransferase
MRVCFTCVKKPGYRRPVSLLLVLTAVLFFLAAGMLLAQDDDQNEGTQFTPSQFDRQDERRAMVKTQIQARDVSDPEVLRAMRTVPRHLFVEKKYRNSAYADRPLPIGHGQTISQPYIVAYMTEQLKLESGDKVLEIGTGSGYQAAVLSQITSNVYTIEIIEELADTAEKRFERLGLDQIRTKTGDGYYGWQQYAPFDAVIVTAAAGHVPPPLVKQLEPGGVIIIPVGPPYQVQMLMRIEKREDGSTRTKRLMPVRFVPMTGKVQQTSSE